MIINKKNKKGITIFMPTIENGGIEKNLILLSNYLIKNEFDVKILCTSITTNVRLAIPNKVKLIKSKKYYKLNFFSKRISDTFNACIFIWRNKFLFKNTIILSLQSHYSAVIISKIIKSKIILRIANHPVGAVKFFQNKFEYNIKLFIKNLIYRYSDGIISNSIESLNYFKNKKFRNKLIYIYNPIQRIKIHNTINKKNKKIILSIGRLEKQKNFIGLLKAIVIVKKKINNLKLIIVGSGSELNSIKIFINENNLKKNVLLVGYKRSEKYFKNSGIFILNSLFEGLPNVLIEALTYKIPIISTNCMSGPKEILSNGKYGSLVPVNDHAALAKKIFITIKNYNYALEKSNKGFKSLSRFEYEKQCKKYLKFIKKIINK